MYRILLTVIILISFAKTSMPLQGWQTCFKALSKLPAEESREIMNYIEAQITAQNTPPKTNVNEQPKDSTKNKKP